MNKVIQILDNTEIKLIIFFIYLISLADVGLKTHSVWRVMRLHLFFALVFSILLVGPKFLLSFFAPLIAVFLPIQNYFLRKYLRNFKQNIAAETVIILGHSNWLKLEAWVKPNFLKSEIKLLVTLLKTEGKDFSFFPSATFEDVEKIMRDPNVKQVYFFGHGTSHTFQLYTEDILYYCEFNDPKYGKEFVNQVHCGTPHGKSLVDYVVPKENRAKCFLFREKIDSYDVERELKKRIEDAKSSLSARSP